MEGKKQGLFATLLALLVLAGAMTVIGIIVWMRMSHPNVPTQPGHSEFRLRIDAGQVLAARRINSFQGFGNNQVPADLI